MRCTQKYKVYVVFNITMGLLLILISEHIMNYFKAGIPIHFAQERRFGDTV